MSLYELESQVVEVVVPQRAVAVVGLVDQASRLVDLIDQANHLVDLADQASLLLLQGKYRLYDICFCIHMM